MLWIYLIVLQILFFIGLLYFLRSILSRKISKATWDLEELSRDYVAKKEEADKLLEKAQREAKMLAAKVRQEAEQTKEKIIKEAQDQREQILKEANKKSMEITHKAERNAEFLQGEMENKIDECAREKVMALLLQAVPETFFKEVHQGMMVQLDQGEFELKHLKLSENVEEAGVVCAFPLTDKQKDELKQKLKKRLGSDVALKEKADPGLIAGFMITIGSVVIDGSLKFKMEKAMQE